jgi:hypothetical protein
LGHFDPFLRFFTLFYAALAAIIIERLREAETIPPFSHNRTSTKRLKTSAKGLKTSTKRLKTSAKRLKTSAKRLKTSTKRLKTSTIYFRKTTMYLSIPMVQIKNG